MLQTFPKSDRSSKVEPITEEIKQPPLAEYTQEEAEEHLEDMFQFRFLNWAEG